MNGVLLSLQNLSEKKVLLTFQVNKNNESWLLAMFNWFAKQVEKQL